jgi:hypothetical protein
MLLTVSPTAYVFVPVGPFEGALAVLLAILEISFVATAVCPGLNTSALHVWQSKLTLIGLVNVSKIVDSEALELPIDELTLIVASILPVEPALAILLALIELSLVSGGSIIPLLFAIAVLSVFNPLPGVHGIVGINKNAVPVCFVIAPLAFVHVPVGMSHPPAPVRLVSPPDPLIFRAVRPDLDADAISFPGLLVKLALVKAALANIFVAIDENPSNVRFDPRFLLKEGIKL